MSKQHTKAMLEAKMTREQANEYARNFRRFTRCWRLENSRAGVSRLVTRSAAFELKAQFGGDIVRVVDAMPHTMTKAEWEALGRGECPRCHAPAGEPCSTRWTGALRIPHKQRPTVTEATHA